MALASRRFSVVPGRWSIVRLAPEETIPSWSLAPSELVSITRTSEELSIVCPESRVPAGHREEPGWAAIRLDGPFAFGETGVLASFASPLTTAGVSIFAVSTFDTDYVLVKASRLGAACHALVAAGHELIGEGGSGETT